jgi:protein subunit release factor B
MREHLFTLTKKDFKINYFSGTGAGGQYRNRHKNCVRLTHIASGVTVTGQSYREQKANLKEAFNNLKKHPKFMLWINKKAREIIDGKTIEQKVVEMMKPEYLKVEVRNEQGNWEILNED